MSEIPEELTAEVVEFTSAVKTLSDRLTVSQNQVRRTKWLMIGGAILTAVALALAGVSLYLWHENKVSQVHACKNANESRAATLVLWQTILAIPNPNATAKEKEQSAAFSTWVDELYAPHDCSSLGRRYVIPPPPNLG